MIKVLKRLKTKDWLMIGLAVVFIVLQVWLDLTLPDYMSEITQALQAPNSTIGDILSAGGMMLLCALGSFAAAYFVAVLAARVASNLSAELRAGVFSKVLSFSSQEINNFSTASLITRSTNDITQVQSLIVMGMQSIIKAPILAVWAIAKIADTNWQWSLTTGIAAAALIIVVGICIAATLPKVKKQQQLTDNLNQVTRENLTGLQVVRAYNAEAYQEEKFEKANEELTANSLFTNKVMSIMSPMISLVMSGLTLAIYWIGASLINAASGATQLTLFSDMVVFSSYAMQVIMSFMMLVMIFILWPRASVSANRINEVLDTQPEILDGPLTASPMDLQGTVEFKDVDFKYPDSEEYVLKDISFTAKQGQTVAFIGSTGCGKSTVVNLIPRFYDASAGEILVDGINVEEYTQQSLRNKIGYVSQRAVLFGGTVSSNVAYGDNGKEKATSNDIVDAVYIAQGADFVEGMPGTYKARIAQGGTNLSGGQKQRLSIARAICRDAEILIFDDSFSALDYRTDRNLRAALNKETQDKTKLIVAQRIGTIKDADKIIVLEDGRIVGEGTHEQLLKDCAVYQEIAYSQLSKEELA